jgi:hypothetical protein
MDSTHAPDRGQLFKWLPWTICGVVCRLFIIKLCQVKTQLSQVTELMTLTEPISRQQWLDQAVQRVAKRFEQLGYEVPQVQISCGFPSTGSRSNRIGECWPTSRCSGGMNEIFITPLVDNAEEVLGIIFHELVHAVDDCKSGHGKAFKTIATKIGLTGKMIHAHPGEELSKQVKLMASELGDYPHKRLITKPSSRPRRERPYAECSECGYRVPMLKKFLEFGPPICPVDHIHLEAEGDW